MTDVAVDKIKALCITIEKLPIPDPDQDRINQAAEKIFTASLLGEVNEKLRPVIGNSEHRPIGSNKAREEIERTERALADLFASLAALHADITSAIDVQPVSNEDAEIFGDYSVLDVMNATASLRAKVQAARVLDWGNAEAARGANVKYKAHSVADVSLKYYEELTGKRATRVFSTYANENLGKELGEFGNFLQAVFDILNIRDNAHSQARKAMAIKRIKITN